MTKIKIYILLFSIFSLYGCEFDDKKQVFNLADQCYTLSNDRQMSLTYSEPSAVFTNEQAPSNLFVTATDLGNYLLYFDNEKRYLAAGDYIEFGPFTGANHLNYPTSLISEVTISDAAEDTFRVSEGEWKMERSDDGSLLFHNIFTEKWLVQSGEGILGLGDKDNALKLTLNLIDQGSCNNFPEAQMNATPQSDMVTHWDNGDLWGMADTHEHIFSNLTLYNSAMHGSAFHKLGIEHALHDCEKVHGSNGNKNVMAQLDPENVDADAMAKLFSRLLLGETYYDTSGYPNFNEWPSPEVVNHQSLYYKWIERAYLGGLRLMTDYVTSAQVMCEAGKLVIPVPGAPRSCDEMEGVDRGIERARHMERYIDAKNGGPGKGWFKIVQSPAQAREVIAAGNMAVVLGMEIESPFHCFSPDKTERAGCDMERVERELDEYYDKGIRAIFPSHKFTNGIATGDGTTGPLEVLEKIDSGAWRDYVACSALGDLPAGQFEGGSNSMLTADSQTYNDMQGVYGLLEAMSAIPLFTPIYNFFSGILDLESDSRPPYQAPFDNSGHCQVDGLSEKGVAFMKMLMKKGMIIDSSHFATQGLADAYALHEELDYAPVQSHGDNYRGKLQELGGVQIGSFYNNCQRSDTGGNPLLNPEEFSNYLNVVDQVSSMPNAYQAIVLGFDFNGYAPFARPRFGEWSHCEETQTNPVSYPFTSFAGDVEFEKMVAGNRTFDVNTDGLVTIGQLPDVIQDLRNNGVSDEQINPLFRGAEGYVRMWEYNVRRSTFIQ